MNAKELRARHRRRAVEEARARGRAVKIRVGRATFDARPIDDEPGCSVEFAKELRRCGADGALVTRALGLTPLRYRPSLRRCVRAALTGRAVGAGLVAIAGAVLAWSVWM